VPGWQRASAARCSGLVGPPWRRSRRKHRARTRPDERTRMPGRVGRYASRLARAPGRTEEQLLGQPTGAAVQGPVNEVVVAGLKLRGEGGMSRHNQIIEISAQVHGPRADHLMVLPGDGG
jgi:hypothetical protein